MKKPHKIESETAAAMWWMLASAAVVVWGFSIFQFVSSPVAKLATLAVAIVFAVLVSRYEIEIPFTNATFRPKTLLAFWGVIMLGVPGGVILGTVSAVAAAGLDTDDRQKWFRRIASDTACVFVAGVFFYIVSGYFQYAGAGSSTEKVLVPIDIILASVVMAIAFYSAHELIEYFFAKKPSCPGSETPSTDVSAAITAGTVSLGATIMFFLVFNHFGIEFGLVLIPLALLGNLGYRFHLRSLDQKTKEIREASRLHLATVEALATAIDARDQVGIGHVRRTQIYAVGLGRVLGLCDGEIEALQTGALLHDIGKLAVPDHILNKPGKLTPAEMEKAKIHSSVGSAILENIGFTNPVVPTVKYHHEAWDGSGYPEKLSGNQIPLTARILTIADAFDTLRGVRPYRSAVAREEACSFLRARSGTQFDPQLVDVFLRHLKRFEDEIASHGLSYELERDQLERANLMREDHGVMSYVEQIQSANREVFTLYSLAKDFSSALNVDETLSLFCRKIEDFVPFDTCLVYLMEPGDEHATAVHTVGLYSDLLKNKRVAVGDGATGYALKQRKAINNVDPALDFAIDQTAIGREYIAMASLPLIAEERLIGAISLYSSSMPNYEEEHMRLIETVSRIAADAISKSLQHAQAETYALTDPMTGLPNARSLQMHFEKEVKRASRSGDSFQVLMLDLDGFKAVNDTFGHKIGDRMLKDVSAIIRNELRDYDFLARYAGDEFVAIIPDTDSHGVLELCRRIESAVKNFGLAVGDETARVGVSVGSACYPNQGELFDQVLIAADKAMYLTKAVHKQRSDLSKWAAGTTEQKTGPERAAQSEKAECEVSGSHVQLVTEDELSFILELDESNIISTAVN
jgi:diguanylate cyclase (GGDEF)-like protein/putative nucleotidyltransferase with HDIG domain